LLEITDGTSNTLMFGERSRTNLPATSSSQSLGGFAWANSFALEDHTMNTSNGKMEGFLNHDLNDFGSLHGGGVGANFAFADGSVRFLMKAIDQVSFQRLSTRAGGENVDPTKFE
jgi:prepilin-type processing-associated H-X9-DG protein